MACGAALLLPRVAEVGDPDVEITHQMSNEETLNVSVH